LTKLLLCGLSGSGKTTTGEKLAELGWVHFDCENRDIEKWLENPLLDLPDNKNVVATWGFLPEFIFEVKLLVKAGYRPIWFYGKEEYLVKALTDRGEPKGFLKQKSRRNQSSGLLLITPEALLNVFRPDGSRWDIVSMLHDAYYEVPNDS
jgi:hypothetical protein